VVTSNPNAGKDVNSKTTTTTDANGKVIEKTTKTET